MKKLFLMLSVALTVTVALTGCSSSLSANAVQSKIRSVAKNNRTLGSNIKVLSIDKHCRIPLQDLIGKIMSAQNLKGDEVWLVTISSTEWEYKQIQLYRRGSHYWLEYL